MQEARPCARSVKTLPLNRRPSRCSERPRMRAHWHCGVIGRAVRPNSTTLARRGASSTGSSRARSRPGGFQVRHPPAADRLFDGAPDFRSVEVLTIRLRSRCPSSRHSPTSTPSPAALGANRVSAEQNFGRHFALVLQANVHGHDNRSKHLENSIKRLLAAATSSLHWLSSGPRHGAAALC